MSTQLNPKPGLSFIVPAYNEEEAITETLEHLKKVLKTLPLPSEILLVNDGSTDRTLERASAVGQIKIITHPSNIGYGASIKAGIRAASYDWIGIMDADGSYSPDDVPKIIAEMNKGFDMVVGFRQNLRGHDSGMKYIFRSIFKRVVGFTVRGSIGDPNSGLRIFKKSVAIKFFPFLCNTFSFTTTLTILAVGEAHFISYLPIQFFPRKGKSKVKNIRDSIRALQLITQGITYFNPMKFFLMLALAMGVGVYLPAMMMGAAGHPALARYYMNFGSMTCLLIGLGALGDIIHATRLVREVET